MLQLIVETWTRHQQQFAWLLGLNTVGWVSTFFVPAVAAITSLVTLGTALVIFVREYRKMKREHRTDDGSKKTN